QVIIKPDSSYEAVIGSSADVSIEYKTIESAILIPVECIVEEENKQYVYMVEDGVLNKSRVEVGYIGPYMAQIIDGVEQGDSVVVSPSEDLEEGRKVNYAD